MRALVSDVCINGVYSLLLLIDFCLNVCFKTFALNNIASGNCSGISVFSTCRE